MNNCFAPLCQWKATGISPRKRGFDSRAECQNYGPDRASVAGCCCAENPDRPVGDCRSEWFPWIDTWTAGTVTTRSAASPTAAQSVFASRPDGTDGPEGRGGSHFLRALVPPPAMNKPAGRPRSSVKACGPQHLDDRDGAEL